MDNHDFPGGANKAYRAVVTAQPTRQATRRNLM